MSTDQGPTTRLAEFATNLDYKDFPGRLNFCHEVKK